ncbi:RNA-binding protein 44 isoform X3 [Marmota monax]|uniref:RNA-binding protein 44 isoform X3 n=1 Tax=Marmota monax TaxID=9995 RepID=UPI0026E9E19D|nr:RNA-binding protein 44 isoform X3 [Marmota monax]
MMQATALMETASGKVYHTSGGSLQKGISSKKENLLFYSNGCNKVKSILPVDEWNTLKQGANKEINSIEKTDLLESYFSASQDTNVGSTHSQSSEFEDSIDYAFLNETYSIHYSESKLNENLALLNSELDPEKQKREEIFFDILERQGKKTVGLEKISKISDDDYKETAEDMQKYDIDEDSQQEYHSAEEQEYISNHLSFDGAKTLSISNLEVVELRNSGYEVKCVSNIEDNHVKLESSSIISLDSLNVFAQEYSPHVSQFQNSVMIKENHESKHEKWKEQETSLMYHTVFDHLLQRNNSLGNQESQPKSGFLNPQKTLKTKIYTEKTKSQIPESKDLCGNTIVENKVSQHLENPTKLPQNKALESLLQSCKGCQTPWASVFDDSVISACGYSCYKSLQSNLDPALGFSVTLPRIAVKDNQAVEKDSSLKVVSNSTTNKICSPDRKGTCPKSVSDAASCTVTVNQTVDVSTDFRACFTTSRATSARSPVVSTSSNTEITMMNKQRPGGWQSGKQTSVACNTDWSCSQDCADTQVVLTKGSGRSLSVDGLKPDGNFLNKDSMEVRKTLDIIDLKKHPERNLPSNSAKKELGSALLSVLEDLKVRYMNLKEKIHKGILLEELPPLSVESKLLSAFSTFASRLVKEESHDFSGADSELDNQSAPDVDVSPALKKTLSQMSLLSESSHPAQDPTPEKDSFKNGDINVDFSQLKLDDKEYRNYREISEDWFDAKENLTGADFSGIQENQIEHDKWNPKFTQEMKNVEPLRRDKCFLIHVGGLCPSVSEADLRSHFQKYRVFEISIYDSSTNYRYASLAFKKNSDAKMAVKEMNGMEINGKSVNVRLVKTPGEYTSPLASKNGNKVGLNNLEKNTNKEMNASCISKLPRTRPRQLGSEQDSEFSPSDQKGVKKNCKQIESAHLLPETPIQFIPPNTLNLRSFTKIMKRLAELHPDVSRDHIIDALQEVRVNRNGFLNGLSISTIVEMTSSVLKNSASS